MKILLGVLILLLVLVGAGVAWTLRSPELAAGHFDEVQLAGDVSDYLDKAEARYDDIVPGVEKRVLWAKAPEVRTGWAVVYVHGFSASSEETRPLPDRVAARLGANLVFTRLAGHGRSGAAMAEGSAEAWMDDMAEALAVGRAVGDRVLLVGTSTGGTLAALAMHRPMAEGVAGVVMLSPNFRIANPAAPLLRAPFVSSWLPMVMGAERGFDPQNEDHARYWTELYPSRAVLPMAEVVAAARGLPHGAVDVPAFFAFDPRDSVVDQAETRRVAEAWGGPAEVVEVTLGPGDDPDHHVIAGDILSPSTTEMLAARIADWAQGL